MKFNTILFVIFISLGLATTNVMAIEWEREKPKVPTDEAQKASVEEKKREYQKKIDEDQKKIDDAQTDEYREKMEAEKRLDEKKVEYINTLLSSFEAQERLEKNPKDPGSQSTLKNNEAERKTLDQEINKIEQQIQTGFTPGKGNLPQKPSSFFDKIKATFKNLIESFTKQRIGKKGVVSSSYEETLNYTKGIAERAALEAKKGGETQLPPEIQPKKVDISKLTLTYQRFKEPSNTNIETYAKNLIDKSVEDAINSQVSFALQNANDTETIEKNLEGTAAIFDFDEGQKRKLEVAIENEVKQIADNFKQHIPSKIIADFFENKAADSNNTVKNLADTIKEVVATLENTRLLSPELQSKIDYIQETIELYNNYAQYSFGSLNPLYRTRLLSFLEGGNAQLAQIYSQIVKNVSGLTSNQLQDMISKRNDALARVNNASKRLVAELQDNQEKLKNTLAYKNESQKNASAKTLSQEAQTIAANLPNLTKQFTAELIEQNTISQTANKFFDDALLKNMDNFIAQAKQVDSSEATIIFAQSILDEITDLQAWLKEYSTLTPLDKTQRNKIATFITTLEQKAGEIRQLWAQNVQNSLRIGANNEPYILPKSSSSSASPTLQPIKDDLTIIQDSSFQLPTPQIFITLQDERDNMTGTASGGL